MNSGLSAFLDPSTLSYLLNGLMPLLATLAVVVVAGLLAAFAVRLLPRRARAAIGRGLSQIYFDMFNGAWRLALLGSAAVLLSVASLWTTLLGVRSFTTNYYLASLIGFGIQAVMLISAWLIGESFATGMAHQSPTARAGVQRYAAWIGMALGVSIALSIFWWLLQGFDATPWRLTPGVTHRFVMVATAFVSALVGAGALYFFRDHHLVRPYSQSVVVIVRNTVLWLMLLASMTPSVFFSFDTHFNAIFSPRLRQETADARAREQIPGLLNDLGPPMRESLEKGRTELLLKPEWANYEGEYTKAIEVAKRSRALLPAQMRAEIRDLQERITEQEKIRTLALSQAAPLEATAAGLRADRDRLNAARTAAQASFDKRTAEVDRLKDELAKAQAEALREEKGVPGDTRSGMSGRGTKWEEATKIARKLQGALDAARLELDAASRQLRNVDVELPGINAQLATIEPQVVELRGSAATANQEIDSRRKAIEAGRSASNDSDAVITQLGDEVTTFRGSPDVEILKSIQRGCNALKDLGRRVNDLAAEADQINCDPRQFSEALTPFVVLRDKNNGFLARCANSDQFSKIKNVDKSKEIDGMLEFANTCVQDSGLPASVVLPISSKLRGLAEIRDDQAQSFVVSLTSFLEGNPLAYLALTIAITVDILVFFAGLFGANMLIGPIAQAGLRDVSARVRRLDPHHVRHVLDAMRDYSFDEAQLNDPQINEVVALGLQRQIPSEEPGQYLVARVQEDGRTRYRLHMIYVDELYELVQRAERRGVFRTESAGSTPAADQPPRAASSMRDEEDRVVQFFTAPRRSARYERNARAV